MNQVDKLIEQHIRRRHRGTSLTLPPFCRYVHTVADECGNQIIHTCRICPQYRMTRSGIHKMEVGQKNTDIVILQWYQRHFPDVRTRFPALRRELEKPFHDASRYRHVTACKSVAVPHHFQRITRKTNKQASTFQFISLMIQNDSDTILSTQKHSVCIFFITIQRGILTPAALQRDAFTHCCL